MWSVIVWSVYSVVWEVGVGGSVVGGSVIVWSVIVSVGGWECVECECVW